VSDYVQSQAHIALALDAALESIVLLKNSKEKGLPISYSTKSVCVSQLAHGKTTIDLNTRY